MKPLFGFFKLEYLNASNCHIRALPENLSHGLPNLKVVNLSHNTLTDITPLQKLKRLRTIILMDNELKGISSVLGIVKDLKKLICLDLRHNPFNAKYYPSSLNFADIKMYNSEGNKHDLDVNLYEEECEEWETHNEIFLRQINDITFVKRLCYRSAVITELPNLKVLDFIQITPEDKILARGQKV
jgi:Leucine-rich repeat (LRR) protein